MTVGEVCAEHRRLGGALSRDRVQRRLTADGWCLDGPTWSDLVPTRVYLSGFLWPRYDRATAAAEAERPNAADQARRLLATIKPATLADIDQLSPHASWVPVDVLNAWASVTLDRGRERDLKLRWSEHGLLTFGNADYIEVRNTDKDRPYNVPKELLDFLGFANHDNRMFKPGRADLGGGDKESSAEARARVSATWQKSFRDWLGDHPEHAEVLLETYNRRFRGYTDPQVAASNTPVPRWRGITLHDYQAEAADTHAALGGGLLAFDVGLGKTYTSLRILARMRAEGRAQRPVVLVPNSLVWKWHRDFAQVLPDYNVGVIGSKRYVGRGGKVRSSLDTPQERGRKWTHFRAGLYDVMLVTYSMFQRTQMRPAATLAYVNQLTAVKRTVRLRQRELAAAQKRAEKSAKARKLSERDEAVLEQGVAGWLAAKLELPRGHEYDTGVYWDDIGVDLLVVDEIQNFKNLYMPEAREGGVPDFMGSDGEGSNMAWHLDFRCAAVRRVTGGAGVLGLSATPAKNSPVELYNMAALTYPVALQRTGITDPEHFVDRYCKLTLRTFEDITGKAKQRLACTGFVNLRELRDMLFSFATYRTASQVGLKLPTPSTHMVDTPLDPRARAAVDQAIAEIEDLDESRSKAAARGDKRALEALSNVILSLKTRISLLGIHPQLPGINLEKVGEDADGKAITRRISNPARNPRVKRANPHSGKLDACVKHILRRRGCGHIVFVQSTAVHLWLKRALVEAGVDAKRVAILNQPTVPKPDDRQRIAEEFNGSGTPGAKDYVAPKYDIVIANSVAYEGVDLQRRTCSIHHLDLPWEPATLQQRNGRGVRQGNTLPTVDIYYYLALGTGDQERLSKIRGKAAWMDAVADGTVTETANPAALMDDDGFDDFLVRHSRDPAKARARVEAKRARAAEVRRADAEKRVRQLLRGANELFRSAARTRDAERGNVARADAEERLAHVMASSSDVFAWTAIAPMVRQHDLFVPDAGPPIFPGLVVRIHDERGPRHYRFGRVVSTGRDRLVGVASLLKGSDARWGRETLTNVASWTEGRKVDVVEERDAPHKGWRYDLPISVLAFADERWLEHHWPRAWAEPSARTHIVQGVNIPVRIEGQASTLAYWQLRSKPEAEPYPPTQAGFDRWLAESPLNEDLTFTEASRTAVAWWDRSIPRHVFAEVRK